MTEVLGILILCYFLIGMEAIVPGGILGVLGFLGMFGAAYFAHVEFGGWFAPAITLLVGGLGGIVVVFAQFKWLSRSPLGKKLFLQDAIDGLSNKLLIPCEIIGERGEALTDMHPEGLVKIGKEEFDAVSEDKLIPKGSNVEVRAVENFRIRVREL
ncbi:MAG: NfeD family protein [Verrucomicrobiota bacterium]|nr:NfeD family protein [Verrucomicrobiota bacterium]